MKQFACLVLCLSVFLAACRNRTPVTESKNESSAAAKQAEVKGAQAVDSNAVKKEALIKTPALSIEELSAVLPAAYNGAKQKNYSANSTMGYTYVEADYSLPKKANLKISLKDCTGTDGANLYESSYLQLLGTHTENENEYTRVVNVLGKKAIENYNRQNNETMLTYPIHDRILVVLQGTRMTPEEVRAAAEQMDLKLP